MSKKVRLSLQSEINGSSTALRDPMALNISRSVFRRFHRNRSTGILDERMVNFMTMDEKKMKTILKETFDTVSGGYDGSALRFFSGCCILLVLIPFKF